MRSIKRIIYGILYLAIFGGLFYFLYLAFRAPAGCTNGRQDSGEEGLDCGGVCANICLPSSFEKLEVSGLVDILKISQNQTVLVADIQNSNQDIAAKEFEYSFEIKNEQNEIIGSVSGKSFAYAGELKHLVGFFRSKDAGSVSGAEIKFAKEEWIKAFEFPRPAVDFVEKRTNQTDTGVEAVGRIINRDVVSLSKVEIVAIFKNGYGSIVGVSQTELENIGPGESREFRVSHPAINDLDPYRTEYTFSALRMVAL